MNINTKKYIENYVKIRNKEGKIVNLELNEPQQRLYDVIKKQKSENKPVRIIILKARQMGFSTATESILFKDTITKFNRRTGIITHLDTATTNLFNMSKLMLDNLPKELKPSIKNSNAKELIFDNEKGTGLKSKIKCMTAGTSGVGRSDTFDNLHLSELAFWQGNVKETLTGLFQAVPNLPDTMIIIESTANGYETFKELWDKAVRGENDFIPLFVAWYELKEYRMPYNNFALTEEEANLKKLYNLDNEQIAWRRWCIRNNCGGDIEQFKQEYPSNPQEAFILSGKTVFDKEKIINRIQLLKKPLKTGYFSYDYDGLKIDNIKWINDPNGYIKLYELPNIKKYCIGCDTAGDGSDYFAAHVIDAKSGLQVATFRNQFDADLFTKQMYCLGKYYKNALIGIEANFDSFPIMELQRLGYDNQYVRESIDTYTGKTEKKFGFKTTSLTRPTIISKLIEIVREHTELFNDRETLEELLTIIKNERGRIEAPVGGHDDLMMSLAITYHIREQVDFTEEPIIMDSQKFFNVEKNNEVQYDYGEEMQVI